MTSTLLSLNNGPFRMTTTRPHWRLILYELRDHHLLSRHVDFLKHISSVADYGSMLVLSISIERQPQHTLWSMHAACQGFHVEFNPFTKVKNMREWPSNNHLMLFWCSCLLQHGFGAWMFALDFGCHGNKWMVMVCYEKKRYIDWLSSCSEASRQGNIYYAWC